MPRNATDLSGRDGGILSTAIGSGGEPAKPAIHLTLQGKGGVGKSLVASILAQYFRHHDAEIHCLDTDPVNQTFSQYAELGAEHLALMHDGKIDSRGFDMLMERLFTENGIFIVDNGASTFIPLWSYIVENNVLELLRAAGPAAVRSHGGDGRTGARGYAQGVQESG
ncbi:MAG: hypothetical protein ABSB23_20700 [Bryobacteraceae bacterium]|jgi:hypothetical protein